ncbi:MAG: nitroreductase family protein [Candidatus Altiarchaeota archaeon]|nr:nitroreductase family protein [Candidatus Altiarchaeota archaeon]
MEALECIKTRRSVRRYQNREVPEELIKIILEVAMSAPSAGNEQAWQFVVITDKKVLSEVSVVSPYAPMARDAGAGILVCGDTNLEKYEGFWVQDCSAATQNLLLAAHALGLGAVWTGVYPMEDRVEGFKKLLKIPKDVIPFAFVPIGYPAQKPKADGRFKEDRVHHDGW